MPDSPRTVLDRYHAAMLAISADDLADLYAADAVHEFPFAPPGQPRRLTGREQVRALYRRAWHDHPVRMEAVDDVVVHDGADPEIVVGEWRGGGALRATGEPFRINGLLILRVRDGLITEARDYMDGLNIAAQLGRTADMS